MKKDIRLINISTHIAYRHHAVEAEMWDLFPFNNTLPVICLLKCFKQKECKTKNIYLFILLLFVFKILRFFC